MIDIEQVEKDIQSLAQQLGVDLSKYGNASPMKIFMAALQMSTKVIQDTHLLLHNEQNPLTATHLKSKLGIAALQGMNVVEMLTASTGKVMIDNKAMTVRLVNHAEIESMSGIKYHLVLPNESMIIEAPTEVTIRQGKYRTISDNLTGEQWQSFILSADDYVDATTVEAEINGRPLKIGRHLDDNADAYVIMNVKGEIELVIDKNTEVTAGDNITISYVDHVGVYGDNIETDSIFNGKAFAFSNDNDVSKEVEVYLTLPLIGGTDFDKLNTDISQEIRFAGKNNLIGTEEQVKQYVKRFHQYIVQSTKIVDGVLTLSCYRNPTAVVDDIAFYWSTIHDIEMTTEDIKSLIWHMNYLAQKSIELLINAVPATISECKAIVNINTSDDSITPDAIAQAVAEYAMSDINTRNFEVGKLYKSILTKFDITEVSCKLEQMDDLSTVTEFGTIQPIDIDSVMLLSYLDVTINGVTTHYGNKELTPDESELIAG